MSEEAVYRIGGFVLNVAGFAILWTVDWRLVVVAALMGAGMQASHIARLHCGKGVPE